MSPAVIITARAFGLDPEEMLGRSRRRAYVRARAAAVEVLRSRRSPATGQPLSYPSIARYFGMKDHSSVMHLASRARDFAGDPEWCAARERIKSDLAAWFDGHEVAPLPVQLAEPRQRVPAVLTKRVKPKNEPAANDRDALARFRASNALIEAIRREHPERIAA